MSLRNAARAVARATARPWGRAAVPSNGDTAVAPLRASGRRQISDFPGAQPTPISSPTLAFRQCRVEETVALTAPTRNPHTHAQEGQTATTRGRPECGIPCAQDPGSAVRVPSTAAPTPRAREDPRTPTSGGGIMVASGHPSSHPQVLVVPLNRRPLMPGVIMPVRVMDERLIQEIEEMKARGQAYVGTFLKRTEGESENVDPSDDMHDIGTFAQVQSVIRVPDISADTLKNEDEKGSSGDDKVDIKAKAEARVRAAKGEDGGGGATLLLLGHRRLRKTATVRHQPMVVQVDHIKDPKVADRDDDDVLKATANEVIATIKDLLKVNPPQRRRFSTLRRDSRISRTPPSSPTSPRRCAARTTARFRRFWTLSTSASASRPRSCS